MVLLSVIIPSMNEEEMILKTASVIHNILAKENISHELIFVDDGSEDSTWEQINAASKEQFNARGIHFSRNFGKESAIYAGLAYAQGDCCAVIDCDLQHPPEKLVEMYRLWEDGFEIVEAVKVDRGEESTIRTLCAKTFYGIISKATDIDMSRSSDFKLLDRKAVSVLLNLKEKDAFFRALSSWIGFKTTQVEFEVQERTAGESKWSTWALIKYALSNISAFSAAPMQMVTVLGGVTLIVSIIFSVIALVQKITGRALGGFTTVILLLLFFCSIIMISLGIIGFYISKIYDEVRDRPRFIVSELCGTEPKKKTSSERSNPKE